MYVKQGDIDKYGKTLTCPGCDSAGTNRWGRHTNDCRERFRRLMQSHEDGRARLAREQAREDRLFKKETAKAPNLDPNIRKAEQEHDDALMEAEARMETDDHEQLHAPEDDHRTEQLQRDWPQPDQEPASSSRAGRTGAGPEYVDIDPPSPATTASYESDIKEDEVMREVGAMAKTGRTGGCTHPQKISSCLCSVGMDISEVYSPPGVAKIAAKRRGISTGTNFDSATEDENGIPWDLSKPDVQERCMARVKKEKPGLLIGSPMCRD